MDGKTERGFVGKPVGLLEESQLTHGEMAVAAATKIFGMKLNLNNLNYGINLYGITIFITSNSQLLITLSGWWFQFGFIFTPDPWGRWTQVDYTIIFKWVGSTTNPVGFKHSFCNFSIGLNSEFTRKNRKASNLIDSDVDVAGTFPCGIHVYIATWRVVFNGRCIGKYAIVLWILNGGSGYLFYF